MPYRAERFWHGLSALWGGHPRIVTLILLGMISTIKNFDLPFIITKGGPAHGTEFFSTYMYHLTFDKFDQGMAAAVVCLLLVLSLGLTILQLRMYGVSFKAKER